MACMEHGQWWVDLSPCLKYLFLISEAALRARPCHARGGAREVPVLRSIGMRAIAGGLWVCLAAAANRAVAVVRIPLTMASAPLVRAPLTSVKLQYGGYDAGFRGQQQGYGGNPQGYGGQQNYGGAQVQWRVEGFCGVTGFTRCGNKYGVLPYMLRNGDEWVLSRWNMLQPVNTVSRVQCIVQILADGTPSLISSGKGPTGVRRAGGPWSPLYKGQRHVLSNGDQVSEGAVC